MTRRTNRWTGATGSDFRIKRGPAKLLGSAVARSTQPLYGFFHAPTHLVALHVADENLSRLISLSDNDSAQRGLLF